MGINNGKFFDAKLSGEYYNILNAAKTLYDKDADDVRNANDDFNSNERFTGLGAGGLKKFIKYGTGKIVDDQTNLYSNIIASQKQVMQAFSDKVDKAPNARMEYDTLEKINTDFKGYYDVYEENAKAVYEIVKALNEEFGDEIEGGFPQPDSKTGRERYIHICGGEDPKAGYFKECQDKLVSFDAEMKGYLNSKNIPNVYDGIKRKVKATSSILGGYNYEAPKFDGAEKLVLDEPKVKAVQAIDRDLDKFCFDIDKLVYKHKKWEPEIDPVTGFPVSSMRCSFDLLERLKDPVAKSVISSPYYNTFKKMVMETSKTHPDDKSTYMITPQDAILAFGVGGAVKSYLEHGNLSELEKNARLNYDAFKDGGVDYMVNYVAGQNAFPAAYGMTNGNESSLLVNLLNTNNSVTCALPNANSVPGLLNASANASGSNSQIAALWNILGNSMGSQNAGTFLKGLYKNAGAAALMSCNATNAKSLLVTTPAPSAGAASMAVAKASTKTTKKEFDTEEELAHYMDEQFDILCDDNDTNDKEAQENIDACMGNFICEKEVDGKKYVAYDKEKIEKTLAYLKHDGLAYQLLDSVDKQIYDNKDSGAAVPEAITELGFGGKVENTKLEVRKDHAGVRLELTSNNDFLPGKEIKKERVAYACTEESATNYFKNGDEYDWKAIEEWYKASDDFNDNYHYTSKEYDVLAFEINNMSDEEASQLINSAVYWKNPACLANDVSDRLDILTDRYMMQMQQLRVMGADKQEEILGYSGKDFENKYTRAVLIRNVNNRLQVMPPTNTYYVEITNERSKFAQPEYDEGVPEDTYGDTDYIANIQCVTSPLFPDPVEAVKGSQTITVHPYSGYAEIQGNINEEVCVTINSMTTNVSSETKKFVFDQGIGYLIGKVKSPIKGPVSLVYTLSSEMMELSEAYESEAKAQGVNNALNQASAAQSMMIEGTTVHVSGAGVESIYVYENAYNDKQLVINVAAYNEQHGTHYTIEQMKNEYISNSNVFNQYNNWYIRYGDKCSDDLDRRLFAEFGKEKMDTMSAEELEAVLKEKGLF